MRPPLAPLLALIPAVVGGFAGLAIQRELLPGSIFVARLQVGTDAMFPLVGLVASGLIAFGRLLVRWHRAALRRVATEERRTEAEAHRRFLRRLNHELKNPLTAIRAGLANLDDGRIPDGAARASLGNVRRQADRLSRLANDLRKLADLDAGALERAPVDLAEIVEEAVELARSAPGWDGRTIALHLQKLPWPLSPIQADRDLLLLAIYNLLDNALKFSDSDAAIELRAGEDGTRAIVEVVDTGRGIASEDLPHVAEELYRGEGTQGIDGSGLGLALVQRVATLHGGELTIRSRPGQGTVAALRLPIGQP